ncbi:MAG: FliM/FliN family flagellar motor switch protein [Pseudomonadales bacterium]
MSSVEVLDIAQVEKPVEQGPALLEGSLDIIKNVKVKLEIRVGDAELTVDELMKLSKNSVVKLTRSTTAPVDMLLDGKVVARGHLVAADDNFGIQISELNN